MADVQYYISYSHTNRDSQILKVMLPFPPPQESDFSILHIKSLSYPNNKFVFCVCVFLPLNPPLCDFPESISIRSWFLLYMRVSGLNARVSW